MEAPLARSQIIMRFVAISLLLPDTAVFFPDCGYNQRERERRWLTRFKEVCQISGRCDQSDQSDSFPMNLDQSDCLFCVCQTSGRLPDNSLIFPVMDAHKAH